VLRSLPDVSLTIRDTKEYITIPEGLERFSSLLLITFNCRSLLKNNGRKMSLHGVASSARDPGYRSQIAFS